MKSRISVVNRIVSCAMRGAIHAAEGLRHIWLVAVLCLAMLSAGAVWFSSAGSAKTWAWKSWERLFGSPTLRHSAASHAQPEAPGPNGLQITPFDDPGAGTGTLQGTLGITINASGVVAGMYSNATGVVHGFVRDAGGNFTGFDPSGAGSSPPLGAVQGTIPIAIDTAGDIVGSYIDSNNTDHAFLRTAGGTITEFDAPGASASPYRGTSAMGINDAGQIVGFYTTGTPGDSTSTYHGFVRAADGTFTTIDAPGAGTGESPIGRKQGTTASVVNASGVIAGTYVDSNNTRHGFVRSTNGTITSFDPSGSTTSQGKGGGFSGTEVMGIDTAGDVVGAYTDASFVRHGYVRAASGTITSFDVPGATTTTAGGSISGTFPLGIDPAGNYIVGTYADSTGVNNAFVYTQPLSGNGTITPFSAPNAGTTVLVITGTAAASVNASGEVVGGYIDANNVGHGFLVNVPLQAVAALPTFSPPAGTYTSAQSVTISDTTPGATIYYTTDGSTPTTNSAVYTGSITVSSSETIKAIATASGYSQSGVATAIYTIGSLPVAATPTFTPPGGTFSTAQSVTISDTTPGAIIYYTTNGTTPSTSSTVYSSPITVNSSETIKAIATASGYTASAVGSSVYAITTSGQGDWTWMGGSSTVNQAGVYGTLGVPAAANIPGGRQIPASWTDASGNVWLFGGWGYDANGTLGQLNDVWEFSSPTTGWTWIGGSKTVGPNGGQPGVYGTLGTPAAGNIPGSRAAASKWTDGSGNLWLFGGSGYDANGGFSTLNDLWKFSPSTSQWTWMAGSNIVGQPGVYGTLGTPAAGNTPGSRYGASSWTDKSGNFWLFGGLGVGAGGAQGWLNDLWVFNPSTNQWAWMGGSSTTYQPGHYGTLRTPAAGNIPGSRKFTTNWTDSSGNLWLFGGYGDDVSSVQGWLNDLWMFNPSSAQWAWMGGNSTVGSSGGQPGVYGTLGTPAAANIPGGRQLGASWIDTSGNLWLFGGEGLDGGGNYGKLNDLWEFNPLTNQWTWMGGSSTVGSSGGQPGVYGTLGIPAASNIPGGRGYAASWSDRSGNFWLLAGNGFGANANLGDLNDLWEYQPPAVSATQVATPTFSPPAGTYASAQSVTISDTTPGATIYYTTDGTTPTTNSAVYNGPLTVSSSEMIKAIATASGYSTSALAAAFYTINPGGAEGFVLYSTVGNVNSFSLYPNSLITVDPASGTQQLVGQPGQAKNVGWLTADPVRNVLYGAGTVSSRSDGTLYTMNPYSGTILGQVTLSQSVSTVAASPQGTLYGLSGNTLGTINIVTGQFSPVGTLSLPSGYVLLSMTFSPGGTLYGMEENGQNGAGFSQHLITLNPANGATVSDIGSLASYTVGDITYAPDGYIYATNFSYALLKIDPKTATNTLIGFGTIGDLDGIAAVVAPLTATPAFSIAPGTYASAQTVTISDTTPGATIYYTTDGTTPSTGSTAYSGPITVASSETIKAIAASSGYANSSVAAAAYIIGPPFTIQLAAGSSGSVTVSAGGTANFAWTITPSGQTTLPAAVSFTATGLPSGATATFSPNPVPAGSGPTSVTLAIKTSTASALLRSGEALWPAILFSLVVPLAGGRRRRNIRVAEYFLWVFLLCAFTGGMTACGLGKAGGSSSGGGGGGGSSQSYTITVTASSGATQQTTTVSLTVQK